MIRFINPGVQPPIYLDTANQRVGIGTSSPAYPLDIKSPSANVTVMRILNSAGTQIFAVNETASSQGLLQVYTSAGVAFAQLGSTDTYFTSTRTIIGATSGNAAAKLQVDSTTSGFLPPRMTTSQKNAISTPPAGLVVYDSTLDKLCVYTGAAWATVTIV